MKPSKIIKLARRQTGCTEDIVTTDEAYDFLNFVIEDFWGDIRASDSWFGFEVLNFDVEANNPVYVFMGDEWVYGFPMSKIQSVWLKGKDNKWHGLPVHFVDKVNPNQFDATGEPRACFVTNSEIVLLPAPKEATQMMVWGFDYNPEFFILPWIVVNNNEYKRYEQWDMTWQTYPYCWIWIDSALYTASETPSTWATAYTYVAGTFTSAGTISKIIDNILDKEEYIWIPRRWHYVLVEWLKYRMYGNMWVNFETARANSRASFDNEKYKALQNITDRWQEADTAYLPDLNYLNY